ncbi:MAG TPA: glycosyltransferase [Geobacteraceae bacterium]
MRIVHVGLELVPSSGGSYQAIRDFSQIADSTVISFTGRGKQDADQVSASPVLHIPTSPGILGRAFSWASERDRARAGEVVRAADLVVCHILWRYHVHWIKALVERYNIPYWVVPHGCLDPYVFSYRSLVKKVWYRLFGRAFLENASSVIFATEKEKSKAAPYYDGENSRVIHWPVAPVDVSRRGHARDAVRRKYGIAADDRVLIYLGRLHSLKCPLETISAFARAGVAGTHLLMVGPEETITADDCMNLAERLHIRNVHLVGPVYGEEKYDYLLASDAFVSLSCKENFGYTTAEALSAGLPVILSPGNDLSDELKGMECGWLLKDNTPETAMAAMREFALTDGQRLARMGENGRRWAVANLGYTVFADKVNRLAASTVPSARA